MNEIRPTLRWRCCLKCRYWIRQRQSAVELFSLVINEVEIKDDSHKIESNKLIISGGVVHADKEFYQDWS